MKLGIKLSLDIKDEGLNASYNKFQRNSSKVEYQNVLFQSLSEPLSSPLQ